MQLLSDEYFICPDCDRHYQWEDGVTGLQVDGDTKRCIPCGLKRITHSQSKEFKYMSVRYIDHTWRAMLDRIREFFVVDVYPSSNPEVLQFSIHAGSAPIVRQIQVTGKKTEYIMNNAHTYDVNATKDLAEMVHDLADVDYPIRFTAKTKTMEEVQAGNLEWWTKKHAEMLEVKESNDRSLARHNNQSDGWDIRGFIYGILLASSFTILSWIM